MRGLTEQEKYCTYVPAMRDRLTTTEAAKAVGIARHTLQGWISSGRVKAPKAIIRNGRAVRLWSGADVKRLAQIKASTYRKGRGRKPKVKQ
jgi:excisionase family DNA binding protein